MLHFIWWNDNLEATNAKAESPTKKRRFSETDLAQGTYKFDFESFNNPLSRA